MNETLNRIISLKKEKNALILAHFYQNAEVRDIADVVGDSFALAKLAQKATQDIIILCGVRFMAESAKILNPEKTVYLPVLDAGCPMADMVTPGDVLQLREQYPEAAVVCYVNSSAAVKAVSDICCTSSSAVRIVAKLPEKQIIFVPDQNLGLYCAKQVPEKEIIVFEGFCPTHHRVTAADAKKAKLEHPSAQFLVHPECRPEVLAWADYIGSTAGILDFARETAAEELVIGTEIAILEQIQREFPQKRVFPLSPDFTCPNMKKTGPDDILRCLEGLVPPIELGEDEMRGALNSLERMVKS